MIIRRFIKYLSCFFIINGWFIPLVSHSYEVETHEDISEEAALQSNLDDYLKEIGLDSLNKVLTDSDKIPGGVTATYTLSILEWIRRGARYEDDTFSESFARYRHHFFNPLNEQGYSYNGVTGIPSPDWGLEDKGDIFSQHYSFKDARQYFYDGLTKPGKAEREGNLARTFRTMGDVIHLIQDAAQPQHTRNDSHGGSFFGPKSLYEEYTNLNSVRLNLPYTSYAPVYPGTDPVTFNNPRKLWHTPDGAGIADYSNRGFVSAGTNFDKKRGQAGHFDLPALDAVTETTVNIQTLIPGTPLTGAVTFYGNSVKDQYRNTHDTNTKTTTFSIFDADLKVAGKSPVFTLNRFNFDEAHKLLIPRAVGYSAGLINYFFRGKLDFVKDPSDSTKYIIKNLGKEAMRGTFALYYDDKNDNRHLIQEWKDLSILAGKESIPVSFAVPTDPAPKNFGEYMLVFNGNMGEEVVDSSIMGSIVGKSIAPKFIYVADTENHRIQIFTKNGDFVSQFGSYGQGFGQFRYPEDVLIDTDRIYVADSGNSRIQIFTKDGRFISAFGSWGDKYGEFKIPIGVTSDSERIYVADQYNDRVQIFSKTGMFIHSFGEFGNKIGQFDRPTHLTVDSDNLYVADGGNDRIQIFSKDGIFKSYFGSYGKGLGQLDFPYGIALSNEQLYISDYANSRIQIFTKSGTFISSFGSFSLRAIPGLFIYPADVDVDSKQIYVVDHNHKRVQIFNKNGEFVSTFGVFGIEPGQFNQPYGIAVDKAD